MKTIGVFIPRPIEWGGYHAGGNNPSYYYDSYGLDIHDISQGVLQSMGEDDNKSVYEQAIEIAEDHHFNNDPRIPSTTLVRDITKMIDITVTHLNPYMNLIRSMGIVIALESFKVVGSDTYAIQLLLQDRQ